MDIENMLNDQKSNNEVQEEQNDQSQSNMTQAEEVDKYLNDTIDVFKSKNLDFAGVISYLSVRGVKEVKVQDVQDMILSDPVIPDDWTPEPLNHLSVYQRLFTNALNKKRLDLFKNHSDVSIPFDEDKHQSFHIRKLAKSVDGINLAKYIETPKDSIERLDFPGGEKGVPVCVHLVKRISQIDNGGEEEDDQMHPGVKIVLCRVKGDKDTDDTGESEWKVLHKIDSEAREKVQNSDVTKEDIQKQYMPFIKTVKSLFQKRRENYSSSEVRDLIISTLKDSEKIGAVSLNKGLYLSYEKAEELFRFSEGLKDIHNGINLATIPLPKFPEGSSKVTDNAFNQVSHSLFDSIEQKIEDVREDIQEKIESDTDTRSSTFRKRYERLQELKDKKKELEGVYKLERDSLEDKLEDAIDTVKGQM